MKYTLLFVLGKYLIDSELVILIFTEVWLYNCITVRLSGDRFISVVFYVDQLAHILVCLKCDDNMVVKNLVFRQDLVGKKVAGMKKTFFTIFDPVWTHILTLKKPIMEFLKQHFRKERQKLYYYQFCDFTTD